MMPSAHPITMISPAPTKPKIGFSIDSIVGDRLKNPNDEDSNDATNENLPKLPTDLRREYSHLMNRSRQMATPSPQNYEIDNKSLRLSESSDQDMQNNNFSRAMKARSRSPTNQNGPLLVPGISATMMNRSQLIPPHGHHLSHYSELPPGHPHFLQFQAAAAFVHAQASQTGFAGGLPQHLPSHLHNVPRDSYPLYPWLLSRHGRIFPHRFPGSKWKHFILLWEVALDWSTDTLLSHLIKIHLQTPLESILPLVVLLSCKIHFATSNFRSL